MNPNVFSQVDTYLTNLFDLEDNILRNTEQSIRDNGMPEHSVSAPQGQFLYVLAKLCTAKRIIEVGTLGGYSSIWLGRALPEGGQLITIEVEPAFARVARQNIQTAGLSEKVEVLTGDALTLLNKLETAEPVDLFFMDADKPNYIHYFQWALAHARPGSLILADNVIRDGQVLNADSTDEKVQGVRAYNAFLAKETRVTSSVLQQIGIKGYDGLAVSVVL